MQICQKNTPIVLHNTTKLIVIAINISMMLVNDFNLFLHCQGNWCYAENFLLVHEQDKLAVY